ncbi:hypothetical protein QQ045_019753 [Rhodiola kirilowii]
MLGLPLGEKPIDIKGRGKDNRVMIHDWRKCFGTETTKITCTDIVAKIKDTKADDPMFKLHFLVLFFSAMVANTKNQWSDQRILNAIDSVDDIRSLNWSEYIIERLKTSKEIWDKQRKANFTGPITFLLGVYMDNVDDRLAKYTRTRPTIKYLTDELFEERYRSLVRQGGFNNGTKVERNDILDTNSVRSDHPVHQKLRSTGIPSSNEDVEEDSLARSFGWLQDQREAASALRKAVETYEMTYTRMLGQQHFKREYEMVHDEVKDIVVLSPVKKCDTSYFKEEIGSNE